MSFRDCQPDIFGTPGGAGSDPTGANLACVPLGSTCETRSNRQVWSSTTACLRWFHRRRRNLLVRTGGQNGGRTTPQEASVPWRPWARRQEVEEPARTSTPWWSRSGWWSPRVLLWGPALIVSKAGVARDRVRQGTHSAACCFVGSFDQRLNDGCRGAFALEDAQAHCFGPASDVIRGQHGGSAIDGGAEAVPDPHRKRRGLNLGPNCRSVGFIQSLFGDDCEQYCMGAKLNRPGMSGGLLV